MTTLVGGLEYRVVQQPPMWTGARHGDFLRCLGVRYPGDEGSFHNLTHGDDLSLAAEDVELVSPVSLAELPPELEDTFSRLGRYARQLAEEGERTWKLWSRMLVELTSSSEGPYSVGFSSYRDWEDGWVKDSVGGGRRSLVLTCSPESGLLVEDTGIEPWVLTWLGEDFGAATEQVGGRMAPSLEDFQRLLKKAWLHLQATWPNRQAEWQELQQQKERLPEDQEAATEHAREVVELLGELDVEAQIVPGRLLSGDNDFPAVQFSGNSIVYLRVYPGKIEFYQAAFAGTDRRAAVELAAEELGLSLERREDL